MNIGIIGVGNIGGMILDTLYNEKNNFNIINRTRSKIKKYENIKNITICKSIKDVYKNSKFIFIAVKPQHIDEVFEEISKIEEKENYIISTAAGKELKEITEKTGKSNVVRIMPTIVSKIGKGVTAITFSQAIEKDIKKEIIELMKPLGKMLELEEEKFDAFTILNSSGPAFVAFILESFIEGAINIGLHAETAKDIVLKTFEGSIKFIEKENIELSELKYKVSSPGGVTIKGLYELEQKGVKGAIMKSVYESYLKNKKL
ncbi:pyrroline-5-carboxylate reductase [Marinitoga hydrogenitolerans]|nr:pyrroline-5-carboxylate reductase [Marinitoga hydrogenitolerans]